jgi:hypothetical protein
MTAPSRTFLFAPGDHARRAEKVLTTGADAAILDLEDAVAISAKVAARALVRAALERPRTSRGFVRVNSFDTEFCPGDIQAVVSKQLDGLVLPKLEDPAQLLAVDWLMRDLERGQGLPERGIEVMPIIETARGMATLPVLMACAVALGGRVKRFSFGAGFRGVGVVDLAWTATLPAVGCRRSQTGPSPLDHGVALKLSEGGHDGQHRLTHRPVGMQSFGHTAEPDAAGSQGVDDLQDVSGVPAQAIELPHGQDVASTQVV